MSSWSQEELAALKESISDSRGFLAATEAVNRASNGRRRRTLQEIKDKWPTLALQLEAEPLAPRVPPNLSSQASRNASTQPAAPAKKEDNKTKAAVPTEIKEEVKKPKKKREKKPEHAIAIQACLAQHDTPAKLREAFPGGGPAILAHLKLDSNSTNSGYLRRSLMSKFGLSTKELYDATKTVKLKATLPGGLHVTISAISSSAQKLSEHVAMYKALHEARGEIEATRDLLGKRKRHLDQLEQERGDYKRAMQTLEQENRELRAKVDVQSLLRL